MDKRKTNIINNFIIAAQLATATTEVIEANVDAINKALVNATENEKLVLFAKPSNLDSSLFDKFLTNKKVITDPTKDELKNTRCGITDAFAAVESTGSVCVAVTGLISAVSMLTQKHIVIVDSNTIVPSPRDILSENYLNGIGLRESFSFITGSSATADMGPLVRGVHGPGKLHIIILE